MKILEVTPYFDPAWAYGGTPSTVSELSYALARRGHQITVLTTDALAQNARMPSVISKNDLEIHYLRNVSNYMVWHHQLLLPVGIVSFLRKHLRDFDLVHLHGFRTYLNVVAHRYSLKQEIPYVFSAHGGIPQIVRKIAAKRVFDSLFGQRILEDASRLIAVSEAEKIQYASLGISASKIAVVYNGVRLKDYEDLPPRGAFIRRYRIEGKKLITYMGRLNARKGLDTLVKAFHQLAETRDDISLALVGPDDGYRRTLEKLIEDLRPRAPIFFPGLVTMPEKLRVLVDSDVVVYPGAYEIFGLVPFEALLCGKPVVVADDSGCGEIVGKARAGFVVTYGDEARLAEAIKEALAGSKEVENMVDRGRAFVLQRLDWDRLSGEIEGVYLEALS